MLELVHESHHAALNNYVNVSLAQLRDCCNVGESLWKSILLYFVIREKLEVLYSQTTDSIYVVDIYERASDSHRPEGHHTCC